MGEGIRYRGYTPRDELEMVPLLKDSFDGWPKINIQQTSLEHWRWKYLDNPYHMRLSSVALRGEKMVGVSGQYPLKIKVGHEWVMGAYCADLGVDKRYRNLGVARKLVEQNVIQLQKNNISIAYFVTSNPHLIKSYSRDYDEFPYKIANMVRIRDIDRQLENMPLKGPNLVKLGYRILNHYEKAKRIFQVKYPKIDVKTCNCNEFMLVLDNLLSVNSRYKFMLDKSREFMRWRFMDPRAGNYIVFHSKTGHGMGYIVIGINSVIESYPIGYIVDVLATPKRTDIVNGLIGKAVEHFNELDINTVSCLITKKHPYEKVLNRHGFIDSKVKIHLFTYVDQSDRLAPIMNHPPEEIHFTYAGLDTLPVEIPEYALS